MARGNLYLITTDLDDIYELDPNEVTSDLGESEIEWSERLENYEDDIFRLADRIKACNAEISKVKTDGKIIPYFTANDEIKENWFEKRFTELKESIALMPLSDFINGLNAYKLRTLIEDKYSDMVVITDDLSGYQTLDSFIRNMTVGMTYYIADSILLH